MHRNWLNLALIVVTALLLAGTALYNVVLIIQSRSEIPGLAEGPLPAAEARHHIIVILPETADPFVADLALSIRETLLAGNSAPQIFRYASGKERGSYIQEADRLFSLALLARADGIIMFFLSEEPIPAFLEKARKAGIPCVPVSLDNPRSDDIPAVSSDSYLHGKAAAREAVSVLGRAARIGVIMPFNGAGTLKTDSFLLGIRTALMEQGAGTITSVIVEEDSVLGGEEAGLKLLEQYTETNVLICASAQTSLSAAQLIVDKGLAGRVFLIGADETPEIARLLGKGIFQAVIVRDAAAIGKSAVGKLYEQISGSTAIGPVSVKPIIKRYGKMLP